MKLIAPRERFGSSGSTPPPSAGQIKGFRNRIREGLDRLGRKSRHLSDNAKTDSIPRTQEDLVLEANLDSNSQHATITSSVTCAQTHDTPSVVSTPATDDAAQIQTDQTTLHTVTGSIDLEQSSNASDIWSTAYREAVESLGKDIDVAILKGENVAQLFKQLEEIDEEASQDSLFLRGVRYLHSLQVPLERFKLALDLASPLASIDPTAGTVVGVVKGVTAIAISFATADLEFAKQIGEMLERISYIDDCDTLGQKTNATGIHKALVLVYGKLLEFYQVATEILTRRGAKLVLKMVLENDRLPNIVKEFLTRAEKLQNVIQKATLEIVEDVRAILYRREISRWLGSEKLSQQSKHHVELQDLRADEACEFLLADAKFISWYRASHSQHLVILGDIGSGKSVAMAFIIDELRRRNEHQLPQPKICYHYCRDDETGQATYIFSALILSLLEQFPGLKGSFYEWYQLAGASVNFEPAADVKQLERLLQKVLEALDRPLFVAIDGLDECSKESRTRLLKSLKNLSQKIPRLKVILSCRPQEEILEQIVEIVKIDLGSDPERDRIIVEKTVERKLSNLSKEVRTLVIHTISPLAQGSAIWTKMVVELIEVRRIRALNAMRDFLTKMPLPKQLSQLYVNLFSRCTSNEPENEQLAMTALEVLAITRRPLSILELAWAVALGVAPEGVTTVDALDMLVDHQRVMILIQPFVAHIDFSDLKKRQVKLVHQSVKEFIVKEWASNRPDPPGKAVSKATDQGLVHQRTGRLEAVFLNICIKYLLLDDFSHTDLFSEEQMAIGELPQEFDLFNDDEEPNEYDPRCTWETWEEDMVRYDPTDRGFGELFVYASCHWTDHFGAISIEHLPGLENIETLCQPGSTRLQSWTKQYCRPQCTIKHRFVFDSRLYDPLSITSLYGSKAMLQQMLERSDFDGDKFLPAPAVGASDQILQWGDLSRLRMLLLANSIGDQLRNLAFFRLIMNQWSISDSRTRDWEAVFDLVDVVSETMVNDRWGNELLCMAASRGCMPIIRRLMDNAQHNADLRAELLRESPREADTAFGWPMHQSIGEAVLGNHVEVVELLLGQQGIEAHLYHRNSRGENVLHLASRHCNPAIFRLLVPHFKDCIHQTDNEKQTALVRVITQISTSQDRYESARILLLGGTPHSDDHADDEQPDPLRIAVRRGDLEMCRLLVCVGKMNPLSTLRRDDGGNMGLRDETAVNEENRVSILQLLRTNAAAESS